MGQSRLILTTPLFSSVRTQRECGYLLHMLTIERTFSIVRLSFSEYLHVRYPLNIRGTKAALTNPLDYNNHAYYCRGAGIYPPGGKILSAAERQDVLSYLAAHPKTGDLIEGTGGVRKLRWGRGGRGKSGGVRIIYYYHSELMPLYLLTLFAKNEQDNLSKAERNELAKLVDILVDAWIVR